MRVRVLLDRPDEWRATAAVLGEAGDRFGPIAVRPVGHREGRAVEVELPLAEGWSVLRLSRSDPPPPV